VHGVLHLLGLDHIRARDAQRMERAEIRILRRLGIADPYAVK
jgi:probable rRNA maturation factor